MPNCWRHIFVVFPKKLSIANQFGKLLEMLLVYFFRTQDLSNKIWQIPSRRIAVVFRQGDEVRWGAAGVVLRSPGRALR